VQSSKAGKMSIKTHLKVSAIEIAIKLDKAIELGIMSAYPIVFNMPPPDNFDWKNAVKLGWRMAKTTARETARVIEKQLKGD
jgi:hypothetical protein